MADSISPEQKLANQWYEILTSPLLMKKQDIHPEEVAAILKGKNEVTEVERRALSLLDQKLKLLEQGCAQKKCPAYNEQEKKTDPAHSNATYRIGSLWYVQGKGPREVLKEKMDWAAQHLETREKPFEEEGPPLSEDEIAAVVHDNFPSLKEVYKAGVKRNPNLSGQVSVEFHITSTGTVSDVRIDRENTTLGDPRVQAEIVHLFYTFPFPKPRGGQEVHVDSYPLDFWTSEAMSH